MSWVAGQALRMREGGLVSFAGVSANHGLGDILVLLLLDIGLRASIGLAKKASSPLSPRFRHCPYPEMV